MTRHRWLRLVALCALLVNVAPCLSGAQDAAVRDLILAGNATPVRLMGYGLVTGLGGTGDRVKGFTGSRQTVQSIVNLLRRFDIEVPPDLLQTKNVAAVLVTSEVSPYLRPGGRFEVQVSSLGDAQSLRGGVLYMRPLVADAGGRPVAAAQGMMMVSGGGGKEQGASTTARIPDGGVLEADLPRPQMASGRRLLLKEPDLGTAIRIVSAIDSAFGGRGNAVVEDPGAITLTLRDTADGFASALSRIRDLKVRPQHVARLVIDSRDGTIVGGGELPVSEAVVSHAGITLNVGSGRASDSTATKGDVRIAAGTSVRTIASVLHALQVTPQELTAIFEALRAANAIACEVVGR